MLKKIKILLNSAMANVIMNESDGNQGSNSKKRNLNEYLKPQEVMAKFKAKSDFMHYFAECRKSLSTKANSCYSVIVCPTIKYDQQGLPEAGLCQ